MNKTVISIFCIDEGKDPIFITDSFPVVPDTKEVISILSGSEIKKYIVKSREFVFEENHENNSKSVFVIIYVERE